MASSRLTQERAERYVAVMTDDPHALFETWLAEAEASEPNDPNAVAVATVGADGMPSVRMVLLKGHDARGFVFYTNQQSRKADELATDPQAALLFHWKSLRRQVRIEGPVSLVSADEADTYWASRGRHSRIGAWASDQSRELPDRLALERRIAEMGFKFGLAPVPRPPHWSGFRLTPRSLEFWRDRPFRLHERLAFDRVEGGWTVKRLYP